MARCMWILAGLFLCGTVIQGAARNVNHAPSRQDSASLRAKGPEGLAEALRVYDGLRAEQDRLRQQANQLEVGGGENKKETMEAIARQLAGVESRIEAAQATIDQIGGQRSCTVSRLYWYTDLAEAKAASERSGRPILSLRMLGKLTDEYSCANSRFFRTALYSNNEISHYLRENFILHWQSVRPVPRVTIDFGDGRKLERTITGNSAHYMLSSDGQPIDVLPGLYSPKAFLSWLQAMHNLDATLRQALESANDPEGTRVAVLKRFHESRRDAVLKAWDLDVQRLGEQHISLVSSRIYGAIEAAKLAGQAVPNNSFPKAAVAAERAATKTVVERPLLRFAGFGGQWMEKGMDDDLWQAVANLHRGDVKLDKSSIDVMRREFPTAATAMPLSVSKMRQEDPVLRMVRSFENSITLDTVRNEYLLHRRVHEQFADNAMDTHDVDRLNEWVYAELFLSPSKDPWLGLARPDVYTALDNDGRVEQTVQTAGSGG